MQTDAADQPVRDRIAEAYLGRWGSPGTQQRARDRVDWMAARARGPRILDIGCSEGILALLLARAGHQVVAIDIEPAAIDAARDLLSREPSTVRDRTDLRVADALNVELAEGGFDTVILGEVIEHLAAPSTMLERAAAFLKPGGRLVLTTPFGCFPHVDHRQEFRTTELVGLLNPRFVADELTVVDGYFRVTAWARSSPVLQERRVQDRRLPSLHQLLVATEEAAVASQRQLYAQLRRLRSELAANKDRVTEGERQVIAAQDAAVALQQHLHGQLKHARGQLKREKDRVRGLRQLVGQTEKAAEASQKYLEGQVETSSHQLAARVEKERALTQKVRRLRVQLEQQERVLAITRARMQQAQVALKRQQQGLRQELGRAVERSLRSPFGVLRLPFRIAKAYRRARESADVAPLIPGPPGADSKGAAGGRPATVGSRKDREPARIIPHRDISSAFPPYAYPERAPRSIARVAAILDEFSDACFRYEADLIRVTKETWRAQMERDRPEFLFVESAWRGNGESWRGLIKGADDTLDNPLEALVDYCKARGIPTVFWNKEDPPNFEHFINAAAKFDHVFTTDANCIERYHARLGHKQVAALPFAAQPAIHNPIGKVESDDHEIAFAGTWYGQKHEERGALLPILLDAAMPHKLHVFDRMSGHTRNDFYKFPDRYAPFLRTALAYPRVLSAYRSFKVFLNVNSVTDSPTMFARRVFEILASETAVVSTASIGIERMLGDVVAVVHDEDEARFELDRILADPIYRQRKAHLGYRKVLREHTYAARFRTIARAIGLELDGLPDSPKVSVVIPLCDERWLENALANLRRQRYPDIAPLWIVPEGAADRLAERLLREFPGGAIAEVGADASPASMLRRGIELAPGPLLTAFDPRDLYGPEFIADLALALSYTDAEIVGKGAHFAALPSGKPPVLHRAAARYRHVDRLEGTAWLARRAGLDGTGIDRMLSVEEGRPVLSCADGGGPMYSADPYNYLRFAGADVTPEALAACLDERGAIAIGRDEVMI